MAEIAQSSASLRFFGDDLDPAELTNLLAGQPTYAVRKGDFHTHPPNQPPRVALKGLWRLSSGNGKGDQLDHQIASILNTLTSDLAVWAELVRRFKVDMFCGVWLDEVNQGLELTPPTLKLLGERGIKLGLDIYRRPRGHSDFQNQTDPPQPLAK
ncbi:DUF4279 domain-containing protein [Mesorhizobium sp. WSM4303]|uniref:DUF4279 domain-containing protein n=1 Tax=unclassified Mesorhizobium TaxID=325217 RepID=UPI00115E4171|nr:MULTISPECIES: DUF4279 domain-containing protein [unclassified Mesorhizobium]TRC96361.1 DUF4279 domain-containing protein [Mesorhizobium sp. WSM4306]TRD06245.1 DUF4279 domain-containing protein [Mesorhizobium sp. WSM4303]